MNMLNKDLQTKIVDRISTVTKKEDVNDQEATKEPVAPPAKIISMETQTDFQKSLRKLEALTRERNQHLL